MDTTKTTTHLGLCAGYGGIELGLKRVIPNLRSVALCEIEAFACANLVSKMEAGLLEPAPIWTDLKRFPWDSFRHRVDILTGGYPCQPFSAAGKRLGTDDPRHLWPFIADGIRILRPKLCFFENVEGHISLGLREVIEELGSIGYKTTWGIFSASEVGAPHQRKRVFILAYNTSVGIQGCGAGWLQEPRPYAGQALPVRGGDAGAEELANAGRIEPQGWCGAADGQQSQAGRIPRGESTPRHDQVWPSRPGESQYEWEPPRVTKGMAHAHGSRGEEPEHQQANLPSESSRGNSEAMGNSAGKRSCGGSEDGPELQPKMFREGYEAMGNANNASWRQDMPERETQGGATAGWTSEAMGDTEIRRRGESGDSTCARQGHRFARSSGSNDELSETQPPMGRNPDGPAGGMDDAELYTTSDNRTDELRLLGNGVVPATAERAFRVLMEEIQRPIS